MSEHIEYIPPSLKHVINGPYAEKRLKNREGFAQTVQNGREPFVIAEGSILDVHASALQFAEKQPGVPVQVFVDSCTSNIISPTRIPGKPVA